MGSTDNETDSSMDDILDSIRQIISEDPSDDDGSAKLAGQTPPSGEPASPLRSEQTPDNLTHQLAEALVRESQSAPAAAGTIPPVALEVPASVNTPTPPPVEKIMDLTQPLPTGSVSAPVSQPASAPIPPQHMAPVNQPIPAPIPTQQAAPFPVPPAPQSGANGGDGASRDQRNAPNPEQPAVAQLTTAQSSGAVPAEGIPVKATLSDAVITPQPPRANGLDALQQALQGVSSSTPDKSAGPIVDLTPIPQTAVEPKPVETEPAPAPVASTDVTEDVPHDVTEDVTGDVTEDAVKDASEDDSSTDAAQTGAVSPTERALRDLVKPMIKSWLDDNMPRLVEDSLREDLDQSEKPDD